MDRDPDEPQSVDEVLEAVWPRERRRARARTLIATIGRTAVFVLALTALSLTVRLLFGLVVPWTFFVFISALALVCAIPGSEGRALLRRDGEPAGN